MPPLATLGGLLVAVNSSLLSIFVVIAIRSNYFDSIIFFPAGLVIIGLIMILLSGVNRVKMLRAVLRSVVELLFPFF